MQRYLTKIHDFSAQKGKKGVFYTPCKGYLNGSCMGYHHTPCKGYLWGSCMTYFRLATNVFY